MPLSLANGAVSYMSKCFRAKANDQCVSGFRPGDGQPGSKRKRLWGPYTPAPRALKDPNALSSNQFLCKVIRSGCEQQSAILQFKSPVVAPTALGRPIEVVDASPLLVLARYQYPDPGWYGVAYSGVCRVSWQLCTDSLFDP
jgi:hypothetical protein